VKDLESWSRKTLQRAYVQHRPGTSERLPDGSRKPWIVRVDGPEPEDTGCDRAPTQEWLCMESGGTSSSSVFDCALRQTLARQYAHRYNRSRRAQTLQDIVRFVPLAVFKLIDRGDALVIAHAPLTGAYRKWTDAERRGETRAVHRLRRGSMRGLTLSECPTTGPGNHRSDLLVLVLHRCVRGLIDHRYLQCA